MNQVNQPTQQALFKPRKVAVKLHYSAISQFCYMWVEYDRPCDYKVQRSKQNPEYLGVCFNVENTETADLIRALPERIRGTEIIDL